MLNADHIDPVMALEAIRTLIGGIDYVSGKKPVDDTLREVRNVLSLALGADRRYGPHVFGGEAITRP